MLDLVERCRPGTGCEVAYTWFDTGLEYRATRDHLRDLEGRYDIGILRIRAERAIPTCAREFGQPFVSKYVSEQCMRLQSVGFRWEDEPYEALAERYPTQLSAIRWWSNRWTKTDAPGWFDIGRNQGLREFMVANPPTFRISGRCCDYAKKRVSRRAVRELGADVVLVGVRQAEGGVRKANSTYRSGCLTVNEGGVDQYRPLYWLSDADKQAYVRMFGIRHSDCYGAWGFKRTGCVGCPFNRRAQEELAIAERFEPNVARAARSVFADSYEYTRRYRESRARMGGQMTLF